MTEHLTAVERRQRDEVEHRERDIQADDEHENLRRPRGGFEEQPAGNRRQQREREIRARPGQRHERVVPPGPRKIRAVDEHGFAPAEKKTAAEDKDAHERKNHRAKEVQVRERVQRHPAHAARRVVAELVGRERVCPFVDAQTADQDNEIEQAGAQSGEV